MRTNLYLYLNRLFGTPRTVERTAYTRTAEIFEQRTSPWLESLKHYFSSTSSCLIVGCGGGTEIGWFAANCGEVTAIDIDAAAIQRAMIRCETLANVRCVQIDDSRLPFPAEHFDIIFLHDVTEHLIAFEKCFGDYHRVLKSGGLLINSFSPLFYSPFGAHLQDALKIPWGHLVFGFEAVRDVRNHYYPGISTAQSWDEFGLNRLTERRYRRTMEALGFADELYRVGVSRNLPAVGRIPLLRNLFILEIQHIARKRAG